MNYTRLKKASLLIAENESEHSVLEPKQFVKAEQAYASAHKQYAAKIAVPVFDGLQMLNTEDIVKCVAHECYTEIVLVDGSKLMVSRLLKEYEDTLSSFNFLRIHNSHLINLRHVKKYIKGEGGYVIMCNGESCEVSRRKKAELLQRLAVVSL